MHRLVSTVCKFYDEDVPFSQYSMDSIDQMRINRESLMIFIILMKHTTISTELNARNISDEDDIILISDFKFYRRIVTIFHVHTWWIDK